jgi:hypothetical protein
LTLTYLFIVGIAAQLAGILGFWTIQKRFHLSTKAMFDVIMVGIILLDGWGMIGIWTSKFGFHHEWEFWVYQVCTSATIHVDSNYLQTDMVRTFRLSMVLLLPNHDQRGYASREGISLLRSVQHHGQDQRIHWSHREQCYHRRQQQWE